MAALVVNLLLVCRVAVSQPAPLALRQLLWLQDELFVSVTCGLLPGSSSLLMLRPDGDALVVRSAG